MLARVRIGPGSNPVGLCADQAAPLLVQGLSLAAVEADHPKGGRQARDDRDRLLLLHTDSLANQPERWAESKGPRMLGRPTAY